MIRPLFIVSVALMVPGCAGRPTEPRIEIRQVLVPTAVSCVPATLGRPPDYPDNDTALRSAADAAARYLLLIAGREARSARLDILEAVIEGCGALPGPGSAARPEPAQNMPGS